jgi:DNA invertase Pin-like site-specific DNA recombinase
MAIYGYTRGADRGILEMRRRGCDAIFTEDDDVTSPKMPGDAFKMLVDKVQRGDTVLISSYDRLTRVRDRLDFILGSLRELGVEVELL